MAIAGIFWQSLFLCFHWPIAILQTDRFLL